MAYPEVLLGYIAYVKSLIAEGKISPEEGEKLIKEYKVKLS